MPVLRHLLRPLSAMIHYNISLLEASQSVFLVLQALSVLPPALPRVYLEPVVTQVQAFVFQPATISIAKPLQQLEMPLALILTFLNSQNVPLISHVSKMKHFISVMHLEM